MELAWSDIWELFRYPIAAALLAGLVCPVVGCFLLVRRTSFYGIVLPQFAAAGVAFGFVLMPWWVAHIGIGDLDLATAMEDSHAAMNYHLGWAGVFTFGGLGVLVLLSRRGGSEVARVAAAFALASAVTILFAHASPTGDIFVHSLLRGEILAVGVHELETIATILGLALATTVLLHRDFLVVSYDRDGALVLGKRVLMIETALMTMTGLTVSAGTLTVGPIVLFGLLVLPPLAGRGLARSMQSLYVFSSLLGLLAAGLGVWASFAFDWPLGPAVVCCAALPLPLVWLLGRSPY